MRFDVLNLDTGERYPGHCGVYRCAWCGPRKAASYAQLACASRPERLVTLTLAPEDWATRRQRMRDLRRRLKADGYRWDCFWTTERNPKGTGLHIHALQHGDFIPQAYLQKQWGSIVHITAIRAVVDEGGEDPDGRWRAARYVVKGTERAAGGGAVSYVAKGALSEGYVEHLALNGGRAAHWGRSYMRTERGDPIAALELRKLLGKAAGAGPWTLIHPTADERQVTSARASWLAQAAAMAGC